MQCLVPSSAVRRNRDLSAQAQYAHSHPRLVARQVDGQFSVGGATDGVELGISLQFDVAEADAVHSIKMLLILLLRTAGTSNILASSCSRSIFTISSPG